jgi:hypothetical protein
VMTLEYELSRRFVGLCRHGYSMYKQLSYDTDDSRCKNTSNIVSLEVSVDRNVLENISFEAKND